MTSPRCATPTIASSRSPGSKECSPRRSPRSDGSSRAGTARRLHWNRVMIYVRQPWVLTEAETAVILIVSHPRPSVPASRNSSCTCRSRARTARCRRTSSTSPTPSGAASRSATRGRHRDPIRPLSEYLQKAVLMRRRGLTTRTNSCGPSPPTEGADSLFPPGQFTDTTSTTRLLVPVDRPPGRTPPISSSVVIRNTPTSTRRHAARHPARRPEPRSSVRSPNPSAAHHRRARPRRNASVPDRMVRPLFGRADRDGERDGEHGLGRARCSAA